MLTRTTLNGQQPRTLRDATRDPFDWLEGPDRHAAEVRRLGSIGDSLIVRVAGGITALWLAGALLEHAAALIFGA